MRNAVCIGLLVLTVLLAPSVAAAPGPNLTILDIPDGAISFSAANVSITPDAELSVADLDSTVVFGYEIRNYLLRLGVRSDAPYENVKVTFDSSYWKYVADWLRVPSGPRGSALSMHFPSIGFRWTYATVPLSATLDFPLTLGEYNALASASAGASEAAPSTRLRPERVEPAKRDPGGGGCGGCIPGYYSGYVEGWKLESGHYGMKDVFVTADDSRFGDFHWYGWTNANGYFQIYVTTSKTRFFEEIRYRGGSDCYFNCFSRQLQGPLMGQEEWTFDGAWGYVKNWSPGWVQQVNGTGYVDVARGYVGRDPSVPDDPALYVDTYVAWETSSSVKVEGSKSIGGGFVFGSASLGFDSDFSETVTEAKQRNSFAGSSAITYKDQFLNRVRDLSGTVYSVVERNNLFGLATLPRPELVDEVSAWDAFNAQKSGNSMPPSNYYTGTDLTAEGGAQLPFDLGSVTVESSAGKSTPFELNLRVPLTGEVFGTFNYRSVTTTSQGTSFTVGAELTTYVPADSDGNALYNVLVWVSPATPMRFHVYLVPRSWA